MSKKPEQPAPDDADLFRQAVKDAVPLPSSDRLPPASSPRQHPTPSAPLRHAATDNLSDHLTSDTSPSEFLRPGMDRMTLRKLRRGRWPVQDSIDLHGNTSDEARRLLANFLQEATQRGLRCVNIIHGKGWHSEGGEGVLKLRTRHWLSQHAQVLAFCEPPEHAGGGGAVWVLLKLGTS
ncbi:MAG TPA: Smr/MutS family protein [Gallionellaceae bacterium]|nr:Smr/MutS family protein [Gallionellaceae bacterium]